MHWPGNPCIILSDIRPWVVVTVAARDAAILHRTSHLSPTRGQNACSIIWFQRVRKRLNVPRQLPPTCFTLAAVSHSTSSSVLPRAAKRRAAHYSLVTSQQSCHFITPRTPLICTTRTTESAPRSVHQIHQDNKGALVSQLPPPPVPSRLEAPQEPQHLLFCWPAPIIKVDTVPRTSDELTSAVTKAAKIATRVGYDPA